MMFPCDGFRHVASPQHRRIRVLPALGAELNLREDSCLILDLGGDEEAARETAVTRGESLPERRGTMTVI